MAMVHARKGARRIIGVRETRRDVVESRPKRSSRAPAASRTAPAAVLPVVMVPEAGVEPARRVNGTGF